MSDVADVPRSPSLAGLLSLFQDVVKDGIRTTEIGKIVSYDADKQSAVIQPLIQERRIDEEGDRELRTIAPLHDVPVMFLGGAKARMTWPVQAGDLCEIRISSSSIARFIASGSTSPIDPGDSRRHDLADAIAYVGTHSPASPPTDAPVDAVVMHLNGVTFKFGSSAAAQAAILGTMFKSALQTFHTALQTAFTAINTYALAIAAIADPSDVATPVLTTALTTTLTAAIGAFNAVNYLSNQVLLLS